MSFLYKTKSFFFFSCFDTLSYLFVRKPGIAEATAPLPLGVNVLPMHEGHESKAES